MPCAMQGGNGAEDAGTARQVTSFEGFRLETAFQPIFSHAHHRAVGQEALLRITDASGQPVAPLHFLCRDWPEADAIALNEVVARLHVANFCRARPGQQWLFLNVDPVDARRTRLAAQTLGETLAAANLDPADVVIEIVEQDIPNPGDLLDIVAAYRELGCLIAIDDFGTGFSNLSRMIRFRPDIVKLDRTFVTDSRNDVQAARCLPLIVNMLHEIGSLVLAEGVENEAHALDAVRADVDLMQGYYFARPSTELASTRLEHLPADGLPQAYDQQVQDHESALQQALDAYTRAFMQLRAAVARGVSLENAASDLLSLPRMVRLYCLDDAGRQRGASIDGANRHVLNRMPHRPLLDSDGANWAHRPYFRRARTDPGHLQVTRPYLSLTGSYMCVTLSQVTRIGRSDSILCCDLEYPL